MLPNICAVRSRPLPGTFLQSRICQCLKTSTRVRCTSSFAAENFKEIFVNYNLLAATTFGRLSVLSTVNKVFLTVAEHNRV